MAWPDDEPPGEHAPTARTAVTVSAVAETQPVRFDYTALDRLNKPDAELSALLKQKVPLYREPLPYSPMLIEQVRKALEMFPNFFLPHMALGTALIQKGDSSAGIEELEKAKAMEPSPISIGILGYAYAKSGRKDEARKLLADLKEQTKSRYVASYWIAMIYVGLNEKDEAFVWLEKAYQERSWWLVWIKMDPKVDSLRRDSRFIDLMRRVGFP